MEMESSPEKPKVGFFNANRKKDKKTSIHKNEY